MTAGDPDANIRQRRQLAEIAIAQAARGEWDAAVETNQEIIELGGDVDAYNRLGKALAELDRHADALESGTSDRAVVLEYGSLAAIGAIVALFLSRPGP